VRWALPLRTRVALALFAVVASTVAAVRLTDLLDGAQGRGCATVGHAAPTLCAAADTAARVSTSALVVGLALGVVIAAALLTPGRRRSGSPVAVPPARS
jgi:hypothetical protein